MSYSWEKPTQHITRQALTLNPQDKGKRGRPRNTWRRVVEADITQLITPAEITQAQSRFQWKGIVNAPVKRLESGLSQVTYQPREDDPENMSNFNH